MSAEELETMTGNIAKKPYISDEDFDELLNAFLEYQLQTEIVMQYAESDLQK